MVQLRLDGKIVGYKRILKNVTLFSKDGYGWNGKPITFNTTDKSANLRDKNAKRLFVNDVISLRDKTTQEEELLVIQEEDGCVVFVSYNYPEEEWSKEDIEAKDKSITRVGYINP